MRPLLLATAFVASLVCPAAAHTWVEQLQVIGEDGTFVGAHGYPRDFYARGTPRALAASPSYSEANNWLVPLNTTTGDGGLRIRSASNVCRPNKRTSLYDPDYPKLKAAPGDWIAIKYNENGHTTRPDVEGSKAKTTDGSGTVFFFATTQPSDDERIGSLFEWTRDGKGGDGRGMLITSQDYDDERCYEINRMQASKDRQAKFPNDNLPVWCENDIQLPESLEVGKQLTLYWVWDWPSILKGTGQWQDEYYSDCIDIEIVAESDKTVKPVPLLQQDPNTKPVENYKERKTRQENVRPIGTDSDGKPIEGFIDFPIPGQDAKPSDGGGAEGSAQPAPTPAPAPANPPVNGGELGGNAPPPAPSSAPAPSSPPPSAPAPPPNPASAPTPSEAPVYSLLSRPADSADSPAATPPPAPPANSGLLTITIKETVFVTGAIPAAAPTDTPAPLAPLGQEADGAPVVVVTPRAFRA